MDTVLYERAAARLAAFGLTLTENDRALLELAAEKAAWTVKNDCNVPEVPEGLLHVAADMAAGEFLRAKKTFGVDALKESGLDLEQAVKQIQLGDTTVAFSGDSQTPEQRLDVIIDALLKSGRGEFACYRKIRW